MRQRQGFGMPPRVREAMESRGLQARDLVTRLPEWHLGTGYRILAGKTTDPWTSTVLELCRALDTHPDELLGTTPPPLPAELHELLEAAQGLSDGDKWLVVDVLRAIGRGREARRAAGVAPR